MPFLLLKDVLDEMSLPVKPFVADSGREFSSPRMVRYGKLERQLRENWAWNLDFRCSAGRSYCMNMYVYIIYIYIYLFLLYKYICLHLRN